MTMAIISAGISLYPDWTFFLQLVLFLITIGVLNFMVFAPVLRILDLRKDFTIRSRQKAQEIEFTAEKLETENTARITAALAEIGTKRAEMLSKTGQNAQDIISKAQEDSSLLLSSGEDSVEISAQKVADMAEEAAESLSENILARVLMTDKR